MIFDSIKNGHLYSGFSQRISQALDYLCMTDFSVLGDGRYDIDGDNVFALVQRYKTIQKHLGKWECHRKYIDIQYIVNGIEMIGFRNTAGMEIVVKYNEENDIEFLKGEGNYVKVNDGSFCILFPHDAHKPKIAADEMPSDVLKVVIKVKV